MMTYTVIIGKMYMTSGAIIPFASLSGGDRGEFRWTAQWKHLETGKKISEVTCEDSFVVYRDIPRLNFVNYGNVDAIVIEEEVSIGEQEATKLIGGGA